MFCLWRNGLSDSQPINYCDEWGFFRESNYPANGTRNSAASLGSRGQGAVSSYKVCTGADGSGTFRPRLIMTGDSRASSGQHSKRTEDHSTSRTEFSSRNCNSSATWGPWCQSGAKAGRTDSTGLIESLQENDDCEWVGWLANKLFLQQVEGTLLFSSPSNTTG